MRGMTGNARPTGKSSSRLTLAAVAGGAALLVAAGGAFASAAELTRQHQPSFAAGQSGPQSPPDSGTQQSPGSTTVTPAGDSFQGNLSRGTTASFSTGSAKLTCSKSSFAGKVPQAPSNTSRTGPLNMDATPPSFTDCPTGNPLTNASVSTNTDNGNWAFAFQNDPAGPKGTVTIPKGGIVGAVTGIANCKVLVAPNGPVTITGDWTPGSASTAARLSIHATDVPMKVTGGALCPTSQTSGAFSATYDITDTTTPGSQITIAN